jgi:hypothetical protein
MPLAGFEPTTPVFKRAKTFHALDRAATVTGDDDDDNYYYHQHSDHSLSWAV